MVFRTIWAKHLPDDQNELFLLDQSTKDRAVAELKTQARTFDLLHSFEPITNLGKGIRQINNLIFSLDYDVLVLIFQLSSFPSRNLIVHLSQLKKLLKLRDAIRGFIEQGIYKGEQNERLEQAKRDVEGQMERYRDLENLVKIKTFSRKGLEMLVS